MLNILITGGAGFIGSNLAERLASDSNNRVVIVDNLSTGRKAYIPKGHNVEFVKADVNNFDMLASVFKKNKFDYVYHYAAVVGVERTLQNPLKVLRDIDGIRNILDLSNDNGVTIPRHF